MAKTKAHKARVVQEGEAEALKSVSVIVADFTGLTANDMNAFRRILRESGSAFRVIKKRLLKIIFEKNGMAFDPKQFSGQVGVVFSPNDMLSTAGVVYTFAKPFATKNIFKILGGFEIAEKQFVSGVDVKRLGQLPSREVLLSQLVGMLASPIRSFLFILNEKAKKG